MNIRDTMKLIEHMVLLERMTPREALAIFAKHGVRATGMAADDLKKAYRGLARKLHPDAGGNEDDLKMVNVAYELLSSVGTGSPTDASPRSSSPFRSGAKPTYANRAPEGDDIYRDKYGQPWYNDLRNVQAHFEKKAEGKPGVKEWSIWNYIEPFFRGSFTIRCNESMFDEAADIMKKWDRFNRGSRAVFATYGRDMYLIWSDGVNHHPPIRMEHESMNHNPSNDQSFMRNLPGALDKIARGEK